MAAAVPFIMPQWFDDNGKPLAGGKLWIYLAGTNTQGISYTDSSGSVPNTNPVILDSSGRASVWLSPGNYKLVLMTKDDVVLWTKDKVKPADGGGGDYLDLKRLEAFRLVLWTIHEAPHKRYLAKLRFSIDHDTPPVS